MKRKTPNGLIAKWKGAFSKGKAPDAAAQPMQGEAAPQGPSLALVKKMPVTFQLSRLENPKDFELMSFVIRACSKTAEKPHWAVLHVERSRKGSRLVACDGHRLHVAEISKRIKSGNYKPYATKDAIALGEPIPGMKFPAWTKAIPEKAKKLGDISLEKSGLGKDRKETEKLTVALHALAEQTGKAVNIRYIEDLTKREWAVYRQNGGQQGIVLRQKDGRHGEPGENSPVAVIMPIPKAA